MSVAPTQIDHRPLIRRGGREDLPFLRSLLTLAHGWRVNVSEVDAPFGRYVERWGRSGDVSVIAIEDGHRIGAAWLRLFDEDEPGYGYLDEATPELTIVVLPGKQGQGVGRLLLDAILQRATDDGVHAVSVAVEKGHPDQRAFELKGFEPAAENGHGTVLRRSLAAS